MFNHVRLAYLKRMEMYPPDRLKHKPYMAPAAPVIAMGFPKVSLNSKSSMELLTGTESTRAWHPMEQNMITQPKPPSEALGWVGPAILLVLHANSNSLFL